MAWGWMFIELADFTECKMGGHQQKKLVPCRVTPMSFQIPLFPFLHPATGCKLMAPLVPSLKWLLVLLLLLNFAKRDMRRLYWMEKTYYLFIVFAGIMICRHCDCSRHGMRSKICWQWIWMNMSKNSYFYIKKKTIKFWEKYFSEFFALKLGKIQKRHSVIFSTTE